MNAPLSSKTSATLDDVKEWLRETHADSISSGFADSWYGFTHAHIERLQSERDDWKHEAMQLRLAAERAPAEPKAARSLPRGSSRIAAQIAHALHHILDDWSEENAQTGEATVDIPADQWKELNRIIDLLGDDPHGVLHDLIGVNDSDDDRASEPPSAIRVGEHVEWRGHLGIVVATGVVRVTIGDGCFTLPIKELTRRAVTKADLHYDTAANKARHVLEPATWMPPCPVCHSHKCCKTAEECDRTRLGDAVTAQEVASQDLTGSADAKAREAEPRTPSGEKEATHERGREHYRKHGHGHVVERDDGVKARCGGPALCKHCQLEQIAVGAGETGGSRDGDG